MALTDTGGSNTPTLDRASAMALSEYIFHHVGIAAKLISIPSEDDGGAKLLVLRADKGNWRVRLGDRVATGMPTTENPSVSDVDGTGAWLLKEDETIVIAAPVDITVKGYVGDSVLSYFWL